MATEPRGIRNNNPGNIRKGKDQWEGMTGDDGQFVTFDSPESGIRAMGRNLLSYGRQGYDSLDKIINRWAPPEENDTQKYIDSVVAATGFKPDQALNLQDPTVLGSLASAIMTHENGKSFSDEQLKGGIERALKGGGITPKSEPLAPETFKSLIEGVSAKPAIAVGQGLPQTGSLDITGKEPEAPATGFSQAFYQQKGETIDQVDDRSTWFGFGDALKAETQNSTLGVAIRAGVQEDGLDVLGDVFNPTRWNSHQWSPDELASIRKQGVRPEYYGVITGGSPQNLQTLIDMALENQKADDAKSKAGFGAQMAAGVVGAGVDPLSYVPIAGAAKGAKLVNKMFTVAAQTGALSGGSELIRGSVAGGDSHVAEAIVGGALFGGGMTAIADGLGRALGSRAANEFHGPSVRLEARETARNTGTGDLSRLPIREGEPVGEHLGVKFADVPNEAGSVRLADGSILIAENPLNPKSQQLMRELEPEKAAWGINLGGVTELGLKLLRSESPEVRGIASDLVRSPTGMESGASGKIGTTSSDVFERLRAVDHRFYNDLDTTVKDALKDPLFQTNFNKDAKASREQVYQRVSMAIEDPSGVTKADLTAGELKVYDLLKNHFDSKREMMENPSMFGRADAQSIFPNSRHVGTYVPNVYSKQAKQIYSEILGGADGLRDAIKQSWLTSYRSRPEVKTRVDEMFLADNPKMDPKQLQAAVEKYANDKAYGISHSDQFNNSSVMEDNIKGLTGLENNSFLEARNMFDSDMSIMLPNGEPFSVNNLREWDMDKIVPAYNRRVNGDISIMAGTGKTTKEMKDTVENLMKSVGDNGKLKADVAALRDTLKIMTGRARRDGADDAAFATAMRSMNDLSFFAKNAYMGIQNLTEIGGMLARGNVRALMHGVPIFRDLAFRNKKMSAKEIRETSSIVFGKELDDSIRPSKADVIERLRASSSMGQYSSAALGGLKYYTGELAVRSPWTKVLTETTNYLLDAGRQGFLSDIVEHTLSGSRRKFDDRWLKTAGVSPEQWKGIKDVINEHVVKGPDGQFTIPNKKAFSQDPRVMDLWRLGDSISDETLLRPHKLSNMDSKAYGPLAKTVLQFKSFVLKSINGRTMRAYYNATKNHRAIDQALSIVMSMGLAGTYYMAQAHMKASAMQDGADRKYLKQALSPEMIGYAALSRSSHIGGPLGVANILGGLAGYEDTKMLRSSVLPRSPTVKPDRAITYGANKSDPVMSVVGNFLEQVPAFGFAANVGASAYNLRGYLQADKRVDERDYMTGMYNTMRELVPNDPITQRLLLGTFEEQGIHIKN